MTKEALKLALEAFETLMIERGSIYDKAIIDIKATLAQPEQEPIGQLCEESYGRGQVMWFNKPVDGSYVYITPPQRTWVGLTDGEVDKMILLMGFPPDWITENAIVKNIVRNLEAKLKEKNS